MHANFGETEPFCPFPARWRQGLPLDSDSGALKVVRPHARFTTLGRRAFVPGIDAYGGAGA
jgi:hypothetical protein